MIQPKTLDNVLLTDATIAGDGELFIGYVLISSGKIAQVGKGNPESKLTSDASEVISLKGKLLLPGVIDSHVHFREPGMTEKGDMATESYAALCGGVTTFADMPNCKPSTTSLKAVKDKYETAEQRSVVKPLFYIGATADNHEDLAKAADITPGIKVFLGASTGGMFVEDEQALDHTFGLGRLVSVHCEDQDIISRNTQKAIEQFGRVNIPVSEHPNIRSREACIASTESAIRRAEKMNTRLNILHVSTAEEIDIIAEAKKKPGNKITAETCVNYLWFCDEDFKRLGSRVKCNPAIKGKTDREALRRAVADGTIDVVSTDHAPHLLKDKEGDALTAASGMPSIQFSLPVMLELARLGCFSIEKVVEVMCHNQAKLLGLTDRGFIREGMAADLVVVDPDAEWIVTDGDVVSRCGWTPFAGTTLHNRIVATIVDGKIYNRTDS